MRLRARTALLAILLAAPTASLAATRPVVVELFTSEGCSSCPPADRLLTGLSGRSDLLPLAFHVTYWNALGWRDPYSFEGATTRQASYAAHLGGGSYTPEMVVDGRRGMVGSESEDVAAAISAARSRAADAIPVTLSGGSSDVRVTVGAGRGHGRILLIGYDPRHETQIGRGENSGRLLVESNIVRSMKVIGRYEGRGTSVTASRGAGASAAVLVQAADGSIIGAARL